ncbi:(2Fe-2S)-binding protein [Mycobacterium sp. MMS18-G62]
MYVCLCSTVTSATALEAIDEGATSSKEVAQACGADSECGRCRATVRGLIGGRIAERRSADAKRSHNAPVKPYVRPQ